VPGRLRACATWQPAPTQRKPRSREACFGVPAPECWKLHARSRRGCHLPALCLSSSLASALACFTSLTPAACTKEELWAAAAQRRRGAPAARRYPLLDGRSESPPRQSHAPVAACHMTKAQETADESPAPRLWSGHLPALFWLGRGAQTTYKMIVDPLANSARAPGLV
jgi:hypothetical protein